MDIKDDVWRREEELDDINEVLGSGLLSLAGWNSGPRAAMFSQHIPQSVLPVDPEVAYVTTGHEHLFGYFATTTTRADGDLHVIKKIRKFSWSDMHYMVVTFNKKTKHYDIIMRQEVKNMAEAFGFKYNNTRIDELREGDICHDNEILKCSPALDEHENFRYGLNALTVFTMSPSIIEDAVEISKRFQKRAKFYNVDDFKININDNDVFLNLYGENGEYKAFPDIGEKSKNSIICGVRRRDKSTEQVMMKNKNLRKVFPDDQIYQTIGDYDIVDIDIWSNTDIDDFPDTENYAQIRKYYSEIIRYNREVFEFLGNIIDNADGSYTYSDALSREYMEARDILDPACKWINNDKIFSNFIISFTLCKKSQLEKGNKVTGRHGNKSVISGVLEDDEMGVMEDGRVPDIRINVLGVIARQNSGQLVETAITWLAKNLQDKLLAGEYSHLEKFKEISEFTNLVNPKQNALLVEYFESLSLEEQNEYIDEMLHEFLYTVIPPLKGITGDKIFNMFQDYEPAKTKLQVVDKYTGKKYWTHRSMVIAHQYILILKQISVLKTSMRSKGFVNPRTNLPLKSTSHAKKLKLLPDQANQMGEQELQILAMGDLDALDFMYRTYASSITARRSPATLEQDGSDGYLIDPDDTDSIVVDQLHALLHSMGLNLEIDYEPYDLMDDDEKYQDIPDIPEELIALFTK